MESRELDTPAAIELTRPTPCCHNPFREFSPLSLSLSLSLSLFLSLSLSLENESKCCGPVFTVGRRRNLSPSLFPPIAPPLLLPVRTQHRRHPMMAAQSTTTAFALSVLALAPGGGTCSRGGGGDGGGGMGMGMVDAFVGQAPIRPLGRAAAALATRNSGGRGCYLGVPSESM